MKNKYISLWVMVVIVLSMTSFANAKGTLHWIRIPLPPFLVTEGEKAVGIAIDIENVLRENMPEYEHTVINSSIKRLHSLLQTKKPCACADYLIRTPAFEEKFYYSAYPTIVTPTHRIIALKKNREKFGKGARLSLKRLLEKPELKLGVTADRSYGKNVDDILETYAGAGNIYLHYSTTSIEYLFKMLLLGRVDYLIEYPPIIQYTKRQLGITEELTSYEIEEKSQLWTTGWVACTKNEQGKRVTEKVNTILPKYLLTEPFYQKAVLLIDLKLFPDFRDLYLKEMKIQRPQAK